MRTQTVAAGLTALCVLAPASALASPSPDEGLATSHPAMERLVVPPLWTAPRASADDRGRPLRGRVVVIDPGHQLGNANHPKKISRLVNAGGFKKPCNTTGTSTNGGWPEATFNWKVAKSLRRKLRHAGAKVYMTRYRNSRRLWGPCINVRGRRGNKVGADVVVSIHGNGASSSNRGFFVIRPGFRRGWTGDIVRPSRRLARKVRHGLKKAGAQVNNQYSSIDARTDLGTLNWSNKPIVMLELGNMRNRKDAHRMHSRHYRRRVYARGLAIGVRRFLHR